MVGESTLAVGTSPPGVKDGESTLKDVFLGFLWRKVSELRSLRHLKWCNYIDWWQSNCMAKAAPTEGRKKLTRQAVVIALRAICWCHG